MFKIAIHIPQKFMKRGFSIIRINNYHIIYCLLETQNFKSLEVSTKEKKSEDDEFEQQRKATIAEALQAREGGKPINFGGQKQVSIFHVYIFTQIAVF